MRYATEIAHADKEISRIRAEVAHADIGAISPASPMRERAAATRAAAYVWLAATLERVVKNAVQLTIREITVAAPALKDLRLSLFALVCDADFNSVIDLGRSGSWQKKILLLERTVDANPALLSEDVLPLDGRTIRGNHFDTIWIVLGMQGPSVPSPLHRIALKDLADGRNDVAHGHLDPVTFGRNKATKDLQRLIQQVDEVIIHLLTELDAYVDNKLYLHR